jgi:hypothetical protein
VIRRCGPSGGQGGGWQGPDDCGGVEVVKERACMRVVA